MNKKVLNQKPTYEFHLSRKSRDQYCFDDTLFSIKGNILFTNFHGARIFVDTVNKKRALAGDSSPYLSAGQVYAVGLIDEVIHYVIDSYRRNISQTIFDDLFNFLSGKLEGDKLGHLLKSFVEHFPSSTVYKNDLSASKYLDGTTGPTPNRHIVMEELIVLWLGNINSAYEPVHEFISDVDLKEKTEYDAVLVLVEEFFSAKQPFGEKSQTLIDMLRAPAKHSPNSLSGQLDFIRRQWGVVIADLLERILKSQDFIKEEEKIYFDGPGISIVPDFAGEEYEEEPERFSTDLNWMPNLVLIAKCTYVWLDQLSKEYGRNIYRLDHIPDEELDRLASSGYTGLWLIGLWERSKASRKIKQLCGNPEAVASAYSLFDYDLAEDLGGEEAYQNLRDRAWERGIRLASDMVPNHMSIDSRWMVEHPDWFIQSDYSPFPSYTFNGPDLSDDERVGIFIEDGYWNKTDAAVVFKRLDRHTGDVKYVYHGNDGTQMPWNDTAQLDYLKGEVREAVIQTILHVARKFPVIRFDAAMTLAKKHYQRLWFPLPGSGGDIPSRAEHSLSKDQFNDVFPVEFWRDVVDRIHEEAPDTLLMAEAFWMMEGYFVRTLGMHRVYNSAFMNMLKKEENGKYRHHIKNVLEYNPQILKRYVNFMNNPDEDTAIDQFGKDDKYFGVCIMMSTMPGLPMFGHGQIEGYTEKYGMEYRRAYKDERPDQHLVERHEREIFPLLEKRYLYSNVELFLLYDFYDNHSNLNENVFAYSNGAGEDRSLVFYNNKFDEAKGWIKYSSPFNDGRDNMVKHDLAYGLGISPVNHHLFLVFRDHMSGLEYIRSCGDILHNGLYTEIGAFKSHIFVEFKKVADSEEHPYGKLMHFLNGSGVPSIDESLADFHLKPARDAFREAANGGSLRYLAGGYSEGQILPDVKSAFVKKLTHLKDEILLIDELIEVPANLLERAAKILETSLTLVLGASDNKLLSYIHKTIPKVMPQDMQGWRLLLLFPFLEAINHIDKGDEECIKRWRLENVIVQSFVEMGVNKRKAKEEVSMLKVLLEAFSKDPLSGGEKLISFFQDDTVQSVIDVNLHEKTVWFNKERFENLLFWLFFFSSVRVLSENKGKTMDNPMIGTSFEVVRKLEKMAAQSAYEYKKFIQNLNNICLGRKK